MSKGALVSNFTDAMVEAAARIITANEYGLADGEPDERRDAWVDENWNSRAAYAREILTAALATPPLPAQGTDSQRLRQVIFDALDLSEELRIECTADVVNALTEAGIVAPVQGTVEQTGGNAILIEAIELLMVEMRRWGWNEGNEGRDFEQPQAVTDALATVTAALPSPAQGTVERAEPVAWGMFSSSAGCLSTTTEEQVAKRWAAESATGISVKALFPAASPPVDSDALKALRAARTYINRGYVNAAGGAVLEQLDAALSSQGSR